MKKRQLFTPGPTQVPEQVLLELAQQVVHHRKSDFKQMYEETIGNLKKVFRTNGEIFVFASSGTGAMEAAVANFTSEGEKSLVVDSGKFGARWKELCDTYQVDSIVLEYEWGKAAEPDDIQKELENNKDIKAVFVTLVETSTGTLHPIKEIAEIVSNTDAVLIVDAVSGLGCDVIETDKWGVDVVVSGSQKALMTPPGIGLMCIGDKAKQIYSDNSRKNYYFDLKKASKSLGKYQTPYTSPVNLIRGLLCSLKMINSEGMENVWERHRQIAQAARKGIKAMGLKLFSESPANGLTAAYIPEQINEAKEFLNHLENNLGIYFAGGQAHMKGKIFRIAHMGYYDKLDILKALCALELALKRFNVIQETGKGPGAAMEAILEHSKISAY
ncbi:MAG: pyridoxal-phosphate-dependent aminotransferase family protein [Elusimicrobiota bacterium]